MCSWTIQLDSELFERFRLAKSFDEQIISSSLSDADFLARLLDIHAVHQNEPYPILTTIPIVSQQPATIEPQTYSLPSELQIQSSNEPADHLMRFSHPLDYHPTLLSVPYLILPAHTNQSPISATHPVIHTLAYTQQTPAPITSHPYTTNVYSYPQHQPASPLPRSMSHSSAQDSHHHQNIQPSVQPSDAPLATGPVVQRFRMAQPLRFAPAWTPKPAGSASPKRAKTQRQLDSPNSITQENTPNP